VTLAVILKVCTGHGLGAAESVLIGPENLVQCELLWHPARSARPAQTNTPSLISFRIKRATGSFAAMRAIA